MAGGILPQGGLERADATERPCVGASARRLPVQSSGFRRPLWGALLASIAAIAFLVATVSPGLAADDKKLTPQLEKMKACNAEAGEKKGDEREAFMSQCLKACAPATAPTQEVKMKE